jgi:hypothetical protein
VVGGLAWAGRLRHGSRAAIRKVPGRARLVTDSDEPEARKRARIRLELAVGYFEQGQTTVALDEQKQVAAGRPELRRRLQPARPDLHAAQRLPPGRGQLSSAPSR